MVLLWTNICLTFLLSTFVRNCIAGKAKLTREQVPPTEIDSQGCQCVWTPWMNNKDYFAHIGDDNTFVNLRRWYDFCEKPKDIKCRQKHAWTVPFHLLHVGGATCDVTSGFKCMSRPYNRKKKNVKLFYCSDFEITVQCCSCPTTTAPTTTTPHATYAPAELKFFLVESQSATVHNSNTANVTATSAEEAPLPDLSLTMILVIVFGCVVIATFIVIIWLILWNSGFHRRTKMPRQDFYQEASLENYSPIKARIEQASLKTKVAFASSSGSVCSSDYATSTSDDEGYRSRPSYSQKRKTKGERNRKLNGSRSNTGDSLELTYPSILQRSSVEESSDEGRFRKWFPDEYERSLQQKRTQPPKQKSIFTPPFTASNRKSIPYMDDLES